MILYQLVKQFEERTKLHAALKQTMDEPVASDLLMQIESLHEQLRMQAEDLLSGIQPENDISGINQVTYLDEGNFITFR